MNSKLLSDVDHETTKIEKKMKRARKAIGSLRVRIAIVLIAMGVVGGLTYMAFLRAAEWFDTHKVVRQTMITIRAPFIIQSRLISPIAPKAEPTVDQVKLGLIYIKIRYIESRAGMNRNDLTATHVYCQALGKVNEVGYFPESNRHYCFADESEQELTLKRWFTKRLQNGYTEDEALCEYNTGTRQPMCKYSIELNNL